MAEGKGSLTTSRSVVFWTLHDDVFMGVTSGRAVRVVDRVRGEYPGYHSSVGDYDAGVPGKNDDVRVVRWRW